MLRWLVTFLTLLLVLIGMAIPVFFLCLVYPYRPLIAWKTRVWAQAILVAAGVRLTIEGAEHISRTSPQFFVGNHQSALDIAILFLATRGNLRFMAKKSLFYIPFFGWMLSLYDFAPIDRSSARATLKSLNRMLTLLHEQPISFAVFPEGTRSTDGHLLPFRRGTMKVCQRAGLEVVPFSINGSVEVHRRRSYRVRPGEVRIRFSEPIPADQVTVMPLDELSARIRTTVADGLKQEPDGLIARDATTQAGPAPG